MNENRYHSMPLSHTTQSSRTRNPGSASPEGRRLIARLRHEPLPPRNAWHPATPDTQKPPGSPLPQGNTPPPNFACNSPTLLSNFESTSLKFRGFLDIANWSDDRIACEIDGELQWPTPTLRHVARSALSHPRLTNSHEPTSIFLEFCGLLMSAADTADEL